VFGCVDAAKSPLGESPLYGKVPFRGSAKCDVQENITSAVGANGEVTVFEVITRVDSAAELARVKLGKILNDAMWKIRGE